MQTFVHKILQEEEFNRVVQEDKYNIVSFSTSWCGPCKMFAPSFENEASLAPSDLGFFKVEMDTCDADLGDSLTISSVPTFRLYKKGHVIQEFSGASLDKLRAMIAFASS